MPQRARVIVESDLFEDAIFTLILLNALVMGVEAVPPLAERAPDWLFWTFVVSQAVFVAEIALRIAACWPRPMAFFRDAWNTFDFVVVALSLVPAVGALTLLARLLRLLRVLRVLSLSDTLRPLVDGRRHGRELLPLMAALFLLLNYILAVAGFHLFGEAIPGQWGDLGRSAAGLAQLLVPGRAGAVLRELARLSAWSIVYAAVFYAVNVGLVGNAFLALTRRREIGRP